MAKRGDQKTTAACVFESVRTVLFTEGLGVEHSVGKSKQMAATFPLPRLSMCSHWGHRAESSLDDLVIGQQERPPTMLGQQCPMGSPALATQLSGWENSVFSCFIWLAPGAHVCLSPELHCEPFARLFGLY